MEAINRSSLFVRLSIRKLVMSFLAFEEQLTPSDSSLGKGVVWQTLEPSPMHRSWYDLPESEQSNQRIVPMAKCNKRNGGTGPDQ